jgi:hypothetical protein
MVNQQKNITCILSTSLGSIFLDKSKRLSIQPNSSVLELKHLIQAKFPGSPPIEFQRLFFEFRLLSNNELLNQLTAFGQVTNNNSSPTTTMPTEISILLDMITGTSSYNRTMSISQALEAYVAVNVHQAYLSSLMKRALEYGQDVSSLDKELFSPESLQPDTLTYRELFDALNASLYEQYGLEIAAALEEERNPDISSVDTASWRAPVGGPKKLNPLAQAWAKNFDTNKQVAMSLLYFSFVLVVRKIFLCILFSHLFSC